MKEDNGVKIEFNQIATLMMGKYLEDCLLNPDPMYKISSNSIFYAPNVPDYKNRPAHTSEQTWSVKLDRRKSVFSVIETTPLKSTTVITFDFTVGDPAVVNEYLSQRLAFMEAQATEFKLRGDQFSDNLDCANMNIATLNKELETLK